jgi:hypothetical protein
MCYTVLSQGFPQKRFCFSSRGKSLVEAETVRSELCATTTMQLANTLSSQTPTSESAALNESYVSTIFVSQVRELGRKVIARGEEFHGDT